MATQYSNVVWADMTTVLARINQARTKHGLSAASLTNNTYTQAAQVNQLVTWLTEANNRIVGTKPTMNVGSVSSGTVMFNVYIQSLYNKASEVYNTCTCNANCSCNCNYCTCNCDNCCQYSCTCNCNYGCTCNCNYGCTCDCNYCTCNCNNCCQYACTCNCNNCPQCPQCPNCPNCPNKGCLGAVYKNDKTE